MLPPEFLARFFCRICSSSALLINNQRAVVSIKDRRGNEGHTRSAVSLSFVSSSSSSDCTSDNSRFTGSEGLVDRDKSCGTDGVGSDGMIPFAWSIADNGL